MIEYNLFFTGRKLWIWHVWALNFLQNIAHVHMLQNYCTLFQRNSNEQWWNICTKVILLCSSVPNRSFFNKIAPKYENVLLATFCSQTNSVILPISKSLLSAQCDTKLHTHAPGLSSFLCLDWVQNLMGRDRISFSVNKRTPLNFVPVGSWQQS